MRTKSLNKAKLVIEVESEKGSNRITTLSVFDNRENAYWSDDRIKERGVEWFLNMADMKETLNWNLNGDSSKYQFKWGQSGKDRSTGRAYIFN